MKFIAALAITNSHMGRLYGQFSALATGGAIGDAIFFFCSGFTLFLGQERRFDNWYKRRISRIYPTVLMWAVITAFFIDESYSIRDAILHGGGWFVSCIMLYYILLFIVRRIFGNKLWTAMIIVSALIVAYFYLTGSYLQLYFYGDGSFRLIFFFLIMLLGAIVGRNYQQLTMRWSLLYAILFVAIFYCILSFKNMFNIDVSSVLNLLTIVCLGGICVTLYTYCNSPSVAKILDTRLGWFVKFIGGLCLEIYVVQHAIIERIPIVLTPINIILAYIAIFVAAYLLKCCSRLFLQTFSKEDYNWREIIKPIE